MKVIIPVAGVGTRLRPHTYTIPKVLINIAGKPIISYIVDKLKHIPNVEFIFILGYLGDKIEEFLENNYKDQVFHYIYQKERLGLGHAIYQANIQMEENDETLIVLGDTIFDTDYDFLNNKNSVLGVKKVSNPKRFGVAIVENNIITKLVEKPVDFVSDLALVGIYFIKQWRTLETALSHIIDNNIKTKDEFQLTDALQYMIESGETFNTHNIDGWYDCGKPETVISTTKILLDKNSVINGGTNTVFIEPCYIPASAKISDSIIGPYVSLGENVVIHSSILKNSLVDCKAELYNVNLDNSLIGANCVVKGKPISLNIGDSSEVIY
ncbi:2-C-methyl-D-erythritol 4-phosphate cytidylyltransferase [bacterium]|nr:2-C-methyl-D-erythritol 4-phosphate cytidylyltransferase [bacterium]